MYVCMCVFKNEASSATLFLCAFFSVRPRHGRPDTNSCGLQVGCGDGETAELADVHELGGVKDDWTRAKGQR